MTSHPRLSGFAALLWQLAAIGVLAAAVAAAQEPVSIPLTEALLLEPVGRAGRVAVHEDALERQIVAGAFTAPKEGDGVTLPDGTVAHWITATVDDNGWFEHPALRGGYALMTFEAPQPRVMLLEAQGHSMVYANGSPRAGDPYRTGAVRLPVLLNAGSNTFLFQVARGGVRAQLVEPAAELLLPPQDQTLPDLLVGEPADVIGAVLVTNVSTRPRADLRLVVTDDAGNRVETSLPPIPPLSLRKVPVRFAGPAPTEPGDREFTLELIEDQSNQEQLFHDTRRLFLRVRDPGDAHRRTFVSDIDGSVQYYAVRPAAPDGADEHPGLVLSLHGAGVEAERQASAYRARPWCHVIAPTNRRPFGFDWEDWGRLDALEVLARAEERYPNDPLRTYLTGHSMGGHGTWILGATFPDRFAAIGPSAGWISFWSYAGTPEYEDGTAIERMLRRAASASDTLALAPNLLQRGVYVLHGDKDDNVPVEQARRMRQWLGEGHPNFAYYERIGAGHWWGDQCMDWPPLFDFLRQNELPPSQSVRHVAFVTASPGVSSRCHWAMIEAQLEPFRLSAIDLTLEPEERRIAGTTDNVARLAIDVELLSIPETMITEEEDTEDRIVLEPGQPLTVELDGQTVTDIAWPHGEPLWLSRGADGTWKVVERPSPDLKGPHRYGSFKDAFRNRFLLVYGTQGNVAENAWARDKARFDAETFWYRGNASVDVIADVDFDRAETPDRNVILYGNRKTNGAWPMLIPDGGPVQVDRGELRIGDRTERSEALGIIFVRPRPGSDVASVGAVGGTGVIGMRLTDRLPYFVSGVGYPDLLVLTPEVLSEGPAGAMAAGYFGLDWSVDGGEIVWTP